MIISRSVLFRKRNFSDKFVEEIKTHILCAITFLPKIVAVMWQCGKIWYSQTGHRWQYGAWAFNAG